MNILIATLGISWQIVPEILGFTNPGLTDLYRNHPDRKRFAQTREEKGICPADEVWAVTSCGSKSDETIEKISAWFGCLDHAARPVLRIWKIGGTDALATETECRRMAEGIHTIVCHAADRTAGAGRLMLSLAGGRKSMSADLQQAGAWFGCDVLLHVVDNEEKSRQCGSRNWGPDSFLEPFPADCADLFTPFCMGSLPRYPQAAEFDCRAYPLSFSTDWAPVLHLPSDDFPLISRIEAVKSRAGYLLSNYTSNILSGEKSTCFLALYSLPTDIISRLKQWRLGLDPSREEREMETLRRLPKAELHCHLGGIATAPDLIRMACAAEPDLAAYRDALSPCDEKWRRAVQTGDPDRIMAEITSLKAVRSAVPEVPPALCTAAFIRLFRDDPDLLDQVIYGPHLDPNRFCGIGFDTYEKIGDLQGTGLLSHPGCLREACRILAENAAAHHVRYLEVRCSPVKYAGQGMTEDRVCRIIMDAFAAFRECLKVSLIFTGARHNDLKKIGDHVRLAERLMESGAGDGPVCLRGFDLAGDEEQCSARDLQEYFLPMKQRCMHFTIHAGETRPPDSIWEAVYYLNAERIGHGLTLKDNPLLMEKVLDRNIALEMCPSSNFQIVGFRDSYLPSTAGRPVYPLKNYLDQGIAVTVNTDNPGISNTDFTRELHRACRLTPGGLSLWEILVLIRNSFKTSFDFRTEKYRMLKQAEQQIIELLPDILN